MKKIAPNKRKKINKAVPSFLKKFKRKGSKKNKGIARIMLTKVAGFVKTTFGDFLDAFRIACQWPQG